MNDLSELELVFTEEELGESASCEGGVTGVDCFNTPEWIAREPCCGVSVMICTPCKAWMENFASKGLYVFLRCAGCGKVPCPEPVFVRA